MYKDGLKKYLYVHRLVAIAFLQNPGSKTQVNHLNGIKSDNKVENLEWATSSENNQHAFSQGLNTGRKGVESSSYKGDIEQYDSNGILVRVIHGGNLALKELGLNPSSVSDCITGRRKTHKGCTFIRVK